MCQIFVACHLSCPHYKGLWHPTLLSCSLARDAARRSSSPHEIYPCGSITTLWNEDLCPYCLTSKLSQGARKYVKECLVKWPLRYEPVKGRRGWLMRWVGRAREVYDIEKHMNGRASSGEKEGCGDKKDCTCGTKKYTVEKRMSNSEYLEEKARQRNDARYFGRSGCGETGYEKETYYDCKPIAKREEVETVYECEPKETVYGCKPKELKRTTETQYKCKPTGTKEVYYTSQCPRTKTVYVETERERRKREKEEDTAYEKYMKARRSKTVTYRRKEYDVDVDVDVNVDAKKSGPRSKKTKSVSSADGKYYYGYY